MVNTYSPGIHILLEIREVNNELLSKADCFRKLINSLIANNDLKSVGEVWHSFDNGGFTGVVCLTESHLSIHTWPEFSRLTFDVFLSNFQKNNDSKTKLIAEEVKSYFQSSNITIKELSR